MIIGGWQKFSLIDFPEKLATVLFTQGCCFRCGFCHNRTLVIPEHFQKPLLLSEIFNFLEKRKSQLQGVVISGGEPLLQEDIFDFIQTIKKMGYAIKLDTSGIFPEQLFHLIQHKLIDYVAMDIKAPLHKYPLVVSVAVDTKKIQDSIDIIMKYCDHYEFRTTVVPSLHDEEDILAIAEMIAGAKKYILQNFSSQSVLDTSLKNTRPFSPIVLQKLKEKIQEKGLLCQVR